MRKFHQHFVLLLNSNPKLGGFLMVTFINAWHELTIAGIAHGRTAHRYSITLPSGLLDGIQITD